MLDYLSRLDPELERRVLTLKKDISAESNSFYDSYRALCECFLRTMLRQSGMPESRGESISDILSREDVTHFFEGVLAVDPEDVKRLRSYVLKINRHVHDRQKDLSLEAVQKYVYALYEISSPYASYMGISVTRPTADDIEKLYASNKINAQELKDELKKQFDIFNEKISGIEDKLNGDEQKKEQFDKNDPFKYNDPFDFKDPANVKALIKKSDTYMICELTETKFKRRKLEIILLAALIFSLGVLQTFFAIKAVTFYSTYTFIENLWHIFTVVLLIKTVAMQREMHVKKFSESMPCSAVPNSLGIHIVGPISKKYTVFLILQTISIAIDLWLYANDGQALTSYTILYTVIAAITTTASFVMYFLLRHVIDGYYLSMHRHRVLLTPAGEKYTLYSAAGIIIEKAAFDKLYLDQSS